MPLVLRAARRFPVQNRATTQRMILIASVSFICVVFSSLRVNADEPLTPLDKKPFKTVPFDPTPSDAQRRELERVVALCVETVGREVPGGHFDAGVDSGIVNTIGIDRERFKFWKCMSGNGRQLAPMNK
jgi:hypothetical protein